MVMRLLRYNSRHRLYWCLGGGTHQGRVPMGRPRLNPISSTSGGGIRTISAHEPLWVFRLRQRLFSFAGRQCCGRRSESFCIDGREAEALPDTWDMGPDGNRTCSYCGSIHPDDLMEVCRRTIDDPQYSVDGTDKSYKVYVRIPGVRNASEGAIKFYMHHAHREPTPEQVRLFADAVRVSRERFSERYSRRFGSPASDE